MPLRQFMQTVVTLLLVLPHIQSVLVQVVGVHVVDAVMDELVVDSTDVLLLSKVVDSEHSVCKVDHMLPSVVQTVAILVSSKHKELTAIMVVLQHGLIHKIHHQE